MKYFTVTECCFFHFFIPAYLTEYVLKFDLTCPLAMIKLITVYPNYWYCLECTLRVRLMKTQKTNVVRNEELFMNMQVQISSQKMKKFFNVFSFRMHRQNKRAYGRVKL